MMSSAFAIVTIQMMLVNGKTKEIGIMRAIGAKRRDILIIFLFQGIIIGAIGATVGTAAGVGYTIFAKETKMSWNNSIALEVSIQWDKIIQTALTSFSLAMLASLYPSGPAGRLPLSRCRSFGDPPPRGPLGPAESRRTGWDPTAPTPSGRSPGPGRP